MTNQRLPENWLQGRALHLYHAVAKQAGDLQRRTTDDGRHDGGVAMRLARLRRAVNSRPGSVPEVWADTIAVLPKDMWGSDDAGPTDWEAAAHTAITLFSLHVQGSSTAVHRKGPSLGAAVRRLAGARASEDVNGPVFKRFQALATAEPGVELNHHLRSMVSLLRSESTQLDYGLLAVDVRSLGLDSAAADRVRLRWGRDYHRTAPTDSEQIQATTDLG